MPNHLLCRTLGVLLLLARAALADAPGHIASPQVNPDRTVTLRLKAARAEKVSVIGDWDLFKEAKPLARGDDGIWSITLGPFVPDIYQYAFKIDDMQFADPENGEINPSAIWGNYSRLEVRGERPDVWTERPEVDRGTLTALSYRNRSRERRGVIVYTPPGYETSRRRYPVLYLVHGYGGNEASWVQSDTRAQVIADNTWADGKGVPCIIVMPNGHVIPPRPGQAYDTAANRTAFGLELLDSVIPLVESRYRVKAGPENRAIAGLSMGARHSLLAGLRHPERFAWIGSMSGGGLQPDELAELSPETLNRRMKLIWISCGRDDEAIGANRTLVAAFDERKIRHVWHEVDGDHTRMVWRRDLAELLTILFR